MTVVVQMSRASLVTQLKELTENNDYMGIHRFLCHPWNEKCTNMCRRQVSRYRLEIWADITEAQEQDKQELRAVV